jgi:hypothetical protein
MTAQLDENDENRRPAPANRDAAKTPNGDSDDALETELSREAAEGADLLGDTKQNRNLSGSSTWETLPDEK